MAKGELRSLHLLNKHSTLRSKILNSDKLYVAFLFSQKFACLIFDNKNVKYI